MSQQVNGYVDAVSTKQNIYQTQHGPRWNLNFKMQDGQWYQIKFMKPEEPIPFQRGAQVSFFFEVKTRINSQTQQTIVDNVVNKKSLSIGGQPMQSTPQPQGGYPQQQGGYQQPQPQYAPQQPQQQYQPQQAAPQAPQVPQENWSGKEGMVTGMAIQCAARLAADISQVQALAAQIILLQKDMIAGLESGGAAYLQGLVGQPAPAPAPQQQAAPVPPAMPEPQAAPQQQMTPAPQPAQPGSPAQMLPAGFDAPPPQQ